MSMSTHTKDEFSSQVPGARSPGNSCWSSRAPRGQTFQKQKPETQSAPRHLESKCNCQLPCAVQDDIKCWRRFLLSISVAGGRRRVKELPVRGSEHDEDHARDTLSCASLREEGVERNGQTRSPSTTSRQHEWCAAFWSRSWRRRPPSAPRHIGTWNTPFMCRGGVALAWWRQAETQTRSRHRQLFMEKELTKAP